MRHVWFDPGETTGWAQFLDDKPVAMGELRYPNDLLFFKNLIDGYDVCGYENYRIQPKNSSAQGHTPFWSTPVALKVIGAIELASMETNIDRAIVSQWSDIKPSGYGFAGMKYVKGKKGMHKQDAIAHGSYWWMMTGRHLESKQIPTNPS